MGHRREISRRQKPLRRFGYGWECFGMDEYSGPVWESGDPGRKFRKLQRRRDPPRDQSGLPDFKRSDWLSNDFGSVKRWTSWRLTPKYYLRYLKNVLYIE